MLVRLSFVLLAAPLLAAGPPADLQGIWRLTAVGAEADAASVPLPDPRPALVIKGDKVLYGGHEIATLAADPKAEPRVIDLKFVEPERTYEGVYRLDKGTLTVCLNGKSEGVKERPDGFGLDGHPAWRLLTFEKIQPEEAGPGAAFVGLVLRLDTDTKEVVVQMPLDKSPAKAAGLLKDDVLLSVGGTGVEDLLGAINLVRKAKPGDELTLRVRRAGKEMDVKVKPTIVPFAAMVGLE
jgi:uncharacterized protein (TIGR03067 family)